MSGVDDLKDIVGKKIKKVFMNEDYLKFVTDEGDFVYRVEGDCCSHSYFHDFYGVNKLLNNGPVLSVGVVDLDPEDDGYGELKCYGYELVTADPTFGEVTSVFSFRNSSNGYYGGWMEKTQSAGYFSPEDELKEDKTGD